MALLVLDIITTAASLHRHSRVDDDSWRHEADYSRIVLFNPRWVFGLRYDESRVSPGCRFRLRLQLDCFLVS